MDEHASAMAAYTYAASELQKAETRMDEACRPILDRLLASDDWKGAYAFVRNMPSSVTKALYADAVSHKWPRTSARLK